MKFIKKILKNDMCIILVPVKNTNIVTMGFFVRAGSRNETEKNNGIAHFLEHMMFKGTKKRDAMILFNDLDTLGAEYNAVTSAEHTYYYIYGNKDNVKQLLDIISDLYINPIFDIKEINKEKKVVIEEMRLRSDEPFSKIYTKIHKKIFNGTSLEREIIGNVNTINTLKKNTCVHFRSSLYKPENTIFVVVGNFDPPIVYNNIEKKFNQLDNCQQSPVIYFGEKDIIIKNMKNQSKPYVHIQKNFDLQQIYIVLAFPMYDLYSYESYKIDLLCNLLSAGFSSRLFNELRENNGITYTLKTYPLSYSDSGLFIIEMILNPPQLSKGLKITLRELKKIKNELITKSEMEKIINITNNKNIYLMEDQMNILQYFGVNFLFNRNFKSDIGINKKITRKQLQLIANEIFVYNKINLFLYGKIVDANIDYLDL